MSLEDVRAFVTVPDEDMVPRPDLFCRERPPIGRAQVARGPVLAFRVVEATVSR